MREVIPAPAPGLDLRREYGHHQSPAIRAGGMVFCSGIVAIEPPARTACALQLSNGSGVEIECVALAGKGSAPGI